MMSVTYKTEPAVSEAPAPSARSISEKDFILCPTADWRWQFVQRHLASGKRTRRYVDVALGPAVKFFRQWLRCTTSAQRDRVRRLDPDLAAAHELFTAGGVLRDEIEARALSEPLDLISAKTSVSIPVLQKYCSLFFDVLGSLGAIDWLLYTVIGLPDLYVRGVAEADVWKYWSLAAGPVLLEVFIADFRGEPVPEIPDSHRLAERMRFDLREFVTPLRDKAAMAAIIEEGRRRFGPFCGIEPRDPADRAALTISMDIVRMAVGLPLLRAVERSEAVKRRNQQKTSNDKDVRYAKLEITNKEFSHPVATPAADAT